MRDNWLSNRVFYRIAMPCSITVVGIHTCCQDLPLLFDQSQADVTAALKDSNFGLSAAGVSAGLEKFR